MSRQRILTILTAIFFLGSADLIGCASGTAGDGSVTTKIDEKPGFTWSRLTESADFPKSYNFPVFVVNGKVYAMLGYGVWFSENGSDWQKTPLEPVRKNVYTGQYVQFRNAVYMLGDHDGNYERIRFSPKIRRTNEMKEWETLSERSNLPGRIFPGIVVFCDRIWVIGGYDGQYHRNDVWSSADGVEWRLETERAAWSPRVSMGLIVFNDRLWLFGGGVIDGMADHNPGSTSEIWSTTDGRSWTKSETQLPAMAGGTPVVFENELWLVGANRDGVFGRASLVTPDMRTWREEPAPWSPRGGVAAWTHNGSLFMTGGKYSYTDAGNVKFVYSNDVWMMKKKPR